MGFVQLRARYVVDTEAAITDQGQYIVYPYPLGVVDLQRTTSLEPAVVDREGDRVEHRPICRIKRTIDKNVVVVGRRRHAVLLDPQIT